MEKHLQKYELTQNGRTYILTTEVEGEFVILKCIETSVSNPLTFIGNYSLTQLKQLSTIFNNITTVLEAQNLLNETIENQKVSVEPQGNILNIILYLSKEIESEDYSIKIGLNSLGVIYNKPLIYNSFTQGPPSPVKRLPTKVISSKSETVANSVYSPVQRLPDTHVNLPPEETKTAQEIITTTNDNYNYQNYENIQNNEIYQSYDNIDLNSGTQIGTNINIYNSTDNPIESSILSTTQNQNQDYNQYLNEYHTNTQNETQFQQYTSTINTDLPYISPVTEEPKIDYSSYFSPKREKIEYVIPGSPSTAQIIYSSAPSHKNSDYQKIVETTKTTTTQHYNPIQQAQNIDIDIYNKKISDLQNETNKIRTEYETIKNEANKLNGEIGGLKGQIHILLEENRILRKKSGSMPNEAQIHEIKILKQENETLRRQLDKYIVEQNTFDQYKRLKEEEIKYLKLQIEELLKNAKKLEEILAIKQKLIDELKLQNQHLINNTKISENESFLMKQKKVVTDSMKNQTLTIQDTRLEIVKGDIIQSSEELELLTRKICKNSKKVTLNLLYKATIDTDKASAFHNKCDWANKTLVLIKSGNGKRFGGYTTCSWRGDSIEKRDENAFVFSLDKMKIYDIIPGEDAIGCYPRYGPVFLGCQIRVFDEFFTKGGTTFEKGINFNTEEDYVLSGGLNNFAIKEIEVYNVQLE